MLELFIKKIRTISLWHLVWMSVVISVILASAIVSLMSLVFHKRIMPDYLITGAVTSVLVAAFIVSVIVSLVKQLQETENQLIQSEKMASIGTLASGIAHELRNPLLIIMQGIGFVEEKLPEEPAKKENIQKIKTALGRASDIIEHLLMYSRSSDFELKDVDVNKTIESARALLERKAALNNIRIHCDLAKEDVKVKGNFVMFQQVFFQLISNAMEAIESEGTIDIVSRIKKPPDDHHEKFIVEIKDTGKGIEPEHFEKIFDPFFTTKEIGRGTGLGLSITRLIIEKHKGSIECRSQYGKGTTFFVTLPVMKG